MAGKRGNNEGSIRKRANGMQIPENRCIYSAPAVRSVRLKRCKYEIPHGARYREKRGVPTATGGKEGKSFPPKAV